MAQKSKKRRHLDRAEIIGAYGEAIKKWPLGIRLAIIGILKSIFFFLGYFVIKLALPFFWHFIF